MDDDIELPEPALATTLGGRPGARYYLECTVRRLIAEHVAAAVAAERERCAQVAEGGSFLHADSPAARFGCECAHAIRRGGPAVPRAEAPPAPAQPEAEQGADARRLDWIEQQPLDDLSFAAVQARPHDSEYEVSWRPTRGGQRYAYGKTLRAAIDAAMQAEREEGDHGR